MKLELILLKKTKKLNFFVQNTLRIVLAYSPQYEIRGFSIKNDFAKINFFTGKVVGAPITSPGNQWIYVRIFFSLGVVKIFIVLINVLF